MHTYTYTHMYVAAIGAWSIEGNPPQVNVSYIHTHIHKYIHTHTLHVAAPKHTYIHTHTCTWQRSERRHLKEMRLERTCCKCGQVYSNENNRYVFVYPCVCVYDCMYTRFCYECALLFSNGTKSVHVGHVRMCVCVCVWLYVYMRFCCKYGKVYANGTDRCEKCMYLCVCAYVSLWCMHVCVWSLYTYIHIHIHIHT
jgi:hypothetical protein